MNPLISAFALARSWLCPCLLAFFLTSHARACESSSSWMGVDSTDHAVSGSAIGALGSWATDSPSEGFQLGLGVGLLLQLRGELIHEHCSFESVGTFAAGSVLGAAGFYGAQKLLFLPPLEGGRGWRLVWAIPF